MISTIDWGLIIDVVMVMHTCSCADVHYERNQKKTNMNECHHSKEMYLSTCFKWFARLKHLHGVNNGQII
jgi:hypothetical protein